MACRRWTELDTTAAIDGSMSEFIKSLGVCVKRTEVFNVYKSVIYRCSQYKKYPPCNYQLKVKEYVDGACAIFESESHVHSPREDATRLPSTVRTEIREMTDNSLTAAQIKKVVKILHPHMSLDSKIKM